VPTKARLFKDQLKLKAKIVPAEFHDAEYEAAMRKINLKKLR
jgi:hypothetical protein